MEERAFGRTGISLPVVGMGTWSASGRFDVRSNQEIRVREQIVGEALAAGVAGSPPGQLPEGMVAGSAWAGEAAVIRRARDRLARSGTASSWSISLRTRLTA